MERVVLTRQMALTARMGNTEVRIATNQPIILTQLMRQNCIQMMGNIGANIARTPMTLTQHQTLTEGMAASTRQTALTIRMGREILIALTVQTILMGRG